MEKNASQLDAWACYDKDKTVTIKECIFMKRMILDLKIMEEYKAYLYDEERSKATIEKYMRDITHFYKYLPEGNKQITKEVLVRYKNSLSDQYKISSINSMIVALNGLLEFMKLSNLKLKLYRVQSSVFYEEDKELTKHEYKRLLDTALRGGNIRLYMLLQTICGTGIRVSEHRYITVESLKNGKAIVHNKGKVRVIFIPMKLIKMLKDYCMKENINRGPVFITRNGKPMDRSNIWNAMKKLCKEAKVCENKVFPHNLRHLFALTYYRMQKDVVRLADILGHASIETTRTYTTTTGKECKRWLSKMDLVVSSYT